MAVRRVKVSSAGIGRAEPGFVPEVGARVEVKQRFRPRWISGYEVVEVADDGVSVRRASDGRVLPSRFATDELRPA